MDIKLLSFHWKGKVVEKTTSIYKLVHTLFIQDRSSLNVDVDKGNKRLFSSVTFKSGGVVLRITDNSHFVLVPGFPLRSGSGLNDKLLKGYHQTFRVLGYRIQLL